MTQERQVIHVREVGVEAWRKARSGAMLAGVTVGEWLTRAIEYYNDSTVELITPVREKDAEEAKEPEHEDFFPDVERTLEPDPDVDDMSARGVAALPELNPKPANKPSLDPAKIPGVSRGAKEPLWKNKKKKQLV